MRLLAIESATLEVGAAVAGPAGPLAVSRSRPGRRHAETLHPAIAEVLERAGTALSDLDGVAVDVGPGLFTGLRVGVAAAKGLAFATGLPLVAVRSTAALRRDGEASDLRGEAAVVPVIDMRRGEIAWELPGCGEPQLGAPTELVASLSRADGELLLVGDGALRWRDEIAASNGRFRFGDEALAAPSVFSVAGIGLELLDEGRTTDAQAIDAVYLRTADARANFATRDVTERATR